MGYYSLVEVAQASTSAETALSAATGMEEKLAHVQALVDERYANEGLVCV